MPKKDEKKAPTKIAPPAEPEPKSRALSVVGGALASRPSYIRAGAEGLEEADNQDFTIPRLAVCNSMSPQRKRTSPKYIAGLEEGQLFNTLTGEIYDQSIDLVPLWLTKIRMKFHPLDEGGGIECQSFNAIDGGRLCKFCADCEHSKFTDEDAPACYLIYGYPSLILRDGRLTSEMIAMSFKSASTKVARNFNTLVRVRNSPLYAASIRVEPVPDIGAGQEFFNFKITQKGWLDDKMYKEVEQFYLNINKDRVKIHEDEPDPAGEI